MAHELNGHSAVHQASTNRIVCSPLRASFQEQCCSLSCIHTCKAAGRGRVKVHTKSLEKIYSTVFASQLQSGSDNAFLIHVGTCGKKSFGNFDAPTACRQMQGRHMLL